MHRDGHRNRPRPGPPVAGRGRAGAVYVVGRVQPRGAGAPRAGPGRVRGRRRQPVAGLRGGAHLADGARPRDGVPRRRSAVPGVLGGRRGSDSVRGMVAPGERAVRVRPRGGRQLGRGRLPSQARWLLLFVRELFCVLQRAGKHVRDPSRTLAEHHRALRVPRREADVGGQQVYTRCRIDLYPTLD